MTGVVESPSAGADEAQRAAVQRRTMRTLVGMQAAGNAAIASVVAVSSLLASDLLGGEGTDDGEPVGDDEPRPATVAAHVLRQRHGDEGRAGSERRAAEAGQRVAAEQVGGQE